MADDYSGFSTSYYGGSMGGGGDSSSSSSSSGSGSSYGSYYSDYGSSYGGYSNTNKYDLYGPDSLVDTLQLYDGAKSLVPTVDPFEPTTLDYQAQGLYQTPSISDVQGAANAYRTASETGTQADKDTAMQAYQDALGNIDLTERVAEANAQAVQEATTGPEAERYDAWLREQGEDPDMIGTSKLYTNPVTGERQMIVPSIAAEDEARKTKEAAMREVNTLNRLTLEKRAADRSKGKNAGVTPEEEALQARKNIQAAIGGEQSEDLNSYFLDQLLQTAKYQKPGQNYSNKYIKDLNLGLKPFESVKVPAPAPVQQVASSEDELRYGGPQKKRSNGYSK